MEFDIKLQELALSVEERDMLDTRIALGLSRFANLISSFDISLTKRNDTDPEMSVVCDIVVKLQAGHKIEVSDAARSTHEVLNIAIKRVKRAIERHLKHHRGPRLGSSMTSRT